MFEATSEASKRGIHVTNKAFAPFSCTSIELLRSVMLGPMACFGFQALAPLLADGWKKLTTEQRQKFIILAETDKVSSNASSALGTCTIQSAPFCSDLILKN